MASLWRRIIRFFIRKAESKNEKSYFPQWCRIECDYENREIKHSIDGSGAVLWEWGKNKGPYYDHIEMSGFCVSTIVSYGVDQNGKLKLNRHVAFPSLRVKPNRTRDNLNFNFSDEHSVKIFVDGKCVEEEFPKRISIKGELNISSLTKEGVGINRIIYPSMNDKLVVEKVGIRNLTREKKSIKIYSFDFTEIEHRGIYGEYIIESNIFEHTGRKLLDKSISRVLKPREEISFYQIYSAREKEEKVKINPVVSKGERLSFIRKMEKYVSLETPSYILNTAFLHSKIRACESIFKTRNGLMHSPGGGGYYGAMWTNDQCQYANPVFNYIGYKEGIEQSINCYNMFKKYMKPSMMKPLISSIISEGKKGPRITGDRGDGAMYSSGAARFALASGNVSIGEKLWDGIMWGIDYSLKKSNKYGVIKSDTDEMEGRFETGKANLSTSCILFDALNEAIKLGNSLGKSQKVVDRLKEKRASLKNGIEDFFGSEVQGYNTYGYYNGNSTLRGWIGLPLAVGIHERVEDTLGAIFSPIMWTYNGIRTESGSEEFWDRATLYAILGTFRCSMNDMAMDHLQEYTSNRLLGKHVPYPVEGCPEGNQKQLSGESALYLRVIIEGLFGIEILDFNSFICEPKLPKGWDKMAIRNITLLGSVVDIEVWRSNGGLGLKIIEDKKILLRTEDKKRFKVTI